MAGFTDLKLVRNLLNYWIKFAEWGLETILKIERVAAAVSEALTAAFTSKCTAFVEQAAATCC
jgi:hypothetical protein